MAGISHLSTCCPFADPSPTRNHMINIVNIADMPYLVDVGFGDQMVPLFPSASVSIDHL